jgi:hypothetical protein
MTNPPTRTRQLLLAIITGGVAAALLDITAAFVQAAIRGGDPIAVLHSIASGVLGREAYRGGASTAALGGAIHLGIATSMSAVFAIAASRVSSLTRRPWLWGPLYGIAAWAVMYLIVLPVRWPDKFPRFDAAETTLQLLFHTCLVGLPIAFAAARFLGAPVRPRR